ncbi:MAG: glycosylase [Erysipelotrichia bacterium]|jgi:beta-1,4-mannooligosaccharide/beta-1,4-mannosyl-N-acetylglucosamine phosphorylase|nr:glycosylase [Erysipelotrichia bacterium]
MIKIVSSDLPNIPWEDKPHNCEGPIWRYSKNPIVKRRPIANVSRVFNSALIPYQGSYIGVFRGETLTGVPYLYLGRSQDGIKIIFEDQPLKVVDALGKEVYFEYAYDPRLIEIENVFYIVFCTALYGPTIGLIKTTDFKHFVMLEHPFLPFNRNGVLFPRKINGEYVMLSRPSDSTHTRFGDIFLSSSPDLLYWGKHRHVMEAGYEWWCNTKIGGGSNPIETSEGWLIFFHGVTTTCNGFVYALGGALLDLEDPSKVLYRSANYLLAPEEDYEVNGFTPNVVFPCSALTDAKTGRIAIYYGGADTNTSLAFTTVNEAVSYIKKYAR